MKVAIVGYGKQGQSAAEYYLAQGHEVTICDQRGDLVLPGNLRGRRGPKHLLRLTDFDLIVRSPIVHPRQITAANPGAGPALADRITTPTNEFFRVCPSRNIIGVTGTKGKGTTSTLIAKMLEAAGKRVHLGGNIGIPPLELLKNNIGSDDWVVLELANFQLIDLKYSPQLAVCLMVEPEHLDWHKDIEEYIAAKAQMFKHQAATDTAIYYAHNENSRRIAAASPGAKLHFYAEPGAVIIGGQVKIAGQVICKSNEIKLLGKHNWQNICAAVTAVWQIEPDPTALRQAITSFGGLPHRLEFVREVDGVSYYDDSFGTTPQTAAVAIQAFTQPKVIILGGSDKGASYDVLAQAVKDNNVRAAVLIGQTGSAIGAALARAGFKNHRAGGATMSEIVATASQLALSGDVVLLSPACASFDMFKNYEDRAEKFKQAVLALA